MRKAAIVIGLGAFFITMALLLRFYAYGQLAVVPLDQNTQQVVVDKHATFFDADNVKPGAGTLTTTARVIGDPAASKKASKASGKDIAVMTKGQTSDNNNEAPPMDAWTGTFTIDRYTGLPVHCNGCPETQDGKPVRYVGQLIKFPFQTAKKDYQYWDTTVSAPMTMKYVDTEQIKGLTVYRFQGTVPPTKFRTQEIPRGAFGLPDIHGVVADRSYSNDRTLWIEPETGVIIKLQEKQHQELKDPEPGAKLLNALTTDSVMSDATVTKNVDDYKSKATLLKILRIWAPLLLALLGIILLLGGIAMSVLGRQDRRDDEDPSGYGYDGEETYDGQREDGISTLDDMADGRRDRRGEALS